MSNETLHAGYANTEMTNIEVQVQHDPASGKMPSFERGGLSIGIVQTPSMPVMVFHTRHHDGTALTAILEPEEVMALMQLVLGASHAARAGMGAAVEPMT